MQSQTSVLVSVKIDIEPNSVVHTSPATLEETLNIQNKIYNLMSEKGWYQTEQAEQQKINSAKQKFQNV